MPLGEFGEPPLRRNLNDLAWLERIARAHEAAIAQALAQTTVVPLRLCTIFADETGARRMLEERGAGPDRGARALDGMQEWAVKVLLDRAASRTRCASPSRPSAREPAAAPPTLRRREERQMREAADRAPPTSPRTSMPACRSCAADAAWPAPEPRLSGHEGDMVLNGAYLVERGRADALRELVAELRGAPPAGRRAARAHGPWPPYHFVPEPTKVSARRRSPQREVALVDLVDRLLAGGVVIGGDITLSIADVDLVYVGLRALITSVATAERAGPARRAGRGNAFVI